MGKILRIIKIFQVTGFFLISFIILTSGSKPKTQVEKTDYIPIVDIIKYLDLKFDYQSAAEVLKVRRNGQEVVFVLGTNELYTGKRVEYLDKKIIHEQGKVLIPAEGVDIMIRHLLRRRVRWSYIEGVFLIQGWEKEKKTRKPSEFLVRPTTQTRKNYDIQRIVIDAGHGGKDPGGIGYQGVKEKDIVLEVTREVVRELKKRFRDKEIIMTRDSDVFFSLEERGELANNTPPGQNAIFVSIHANVGLDKSTRGYESYYLSLSPLGEEAREVASKENSVLEFEVPDSREYLKEILNRIVDIEYRRESMKLAGYIQERLFSSLGELSLNRGVKSAFFYVLKAVKMPGVLVEIGFITNREEALYLQSSEYQKKLARGIADGVYDFIIEFQKTEGFTR